MRPFGSDVVFALNEPSLNTQFGFLREQNRRLELAGWLSLSFHSEV